MSTEFAWDQSSLSQADKVSNLPRLTDKDVIRETISKMMNGRAAGSSDIVREAGVDMITDLVNQISFSIRTETQHYCKLSLGKRRLF